MKIVEYCLIIRDGLGVNDVKLNVIKKTHKPRDSHEPVVTHMEDNSHQAILTS